MNRNPAQLISVLYMSAIYSFLYLPILILILFSFNQSKVNAVWTAFTLDWYGKLLQNGEIWEAAKNSLITAGLSTIISTMVGTLAAVAMYRFRVRSKSVFDSLVYLPIVIPEIVMGISLLAFFAILKIPLGLMTLVAAHATFCIPFVIVVIRARLLGVDRSIEEAALDLGATPWQTFWHILLPNLMPGIWASALLSFTLSIDDVIISFFVAGPGSTTLPLKIFSMAKLGVSPEINALSTLMLVVSLTIVVLAERLRFRKYK